MRTAEFQLAVHCCRLAFDGGYAAPAVLHDRFDWQRFYRLAQFHRVQGLVWKSLSSLEGFLPGEVARRIAADAARIATTNRDSLAECRTLADALHPSGIDCLFLKGLPLGLLAYGSTVMSGSRPCSIFLAFVVHWKTGPPRPRPILKNFFRLNSACHGHC